MTINKLESQIRTYVAENILYTHDFPHDDDASFLNSGLIDSLGVMELLMYVQTEFGIHVSPLEVTPENFDSVARLSAYIRNKLQEPLAIPA